MKNGNYIVLIFLRDFLKVKKVMDSECKGINKLKLRKLKKWWDAYYEKIVEDIDRKKVEAMADNSSGEYGKYYESLMNLSYYPKLNDDRSVKILASDAMDNVEAFISGIGAAIFDSRKL